MCSLIFKIITIISLLFHLTCVHSLPTTQATLRRSIQSSCIWGSWSEFGDCTNGLMSRNRPCVCENNVVYPPKFCTAGVSFLESVNCQNIGKGMAVEEGTHHDYMLKTGSNDEMSLVEVDEVGSPSNVTVGDSTSQPPSICEWKWDRWSECTQECGFSPIGNTTRTQQCWCIGMMIPENETMCKDDHPKWTETVPCNDYPCNGVRPQNKIVWQELYMSAQNSNQDLWPLPSNETFSCSRGDQYNFSNKSWGEILQDLPYEENPSWYFLAREYITGRLNKAHGSPTSPETNQALEEAQYLLSKCDGYNSHDNLLAYITKEKLSRSNNGIGGLSNVDTQMGLVYGGDSGSKDSVIVILPDAHNVLIGLVVVLVVVGVLVFIVYRLRMRRVEVIDNERYSYSSDEEYPDYRDERDETTL